MKVFSLPINPKLTEELVEDYYIPFLIDHKEYIFDLYFTCRMPPFMQDAMGDIFIDDVRSTTINALYISERTGIPLSATFNNIQVVPNQENLDIWITNFKPLYDAGIRIVTLPHTSWVLTGQIQKEFPELYIKNTILREVSKANEIVSLAKAGFNYINLDRDLMRDKDSLIRIKEAKDYCRDKGIPVKLSMLANEGCRGGCPIMPEHYHYNSTRKQNNPQYFNDSISRVSCSSWDEKDAATSFKAANLPPWKSDWEEFLDLGIDVFKMHGRENIMRLKESTDIISRWKSNDSILFPQFNNYIDDLSLTDRPIDIWRDKIKNCKFDCWKCNYCDSVVESRLKKDKKKLNALVDLTLSSIDDAAKKQSKFNQKDYQIQGLSSEYIRHFLNNLCSYENAVYLEVGCYTGSTFFAAVQHNTCQAIAVDNFSEKSIKPFRNDILFLTISDPERYFLDRCINDKWKLINSDIKQVTNLNAVPNIIFYDASHEYDSQLENLNHILSLVDDEFILIVDDANFEGVVQSCDRFIEDNNLNPLYQRKILTTVPEDNTSWWNGIYINVLKKI